MTAPAPSVAMREQKARFGSRFRREASRLTRDEVEREGRVVRLAFESLGAVEARAFLNTADPALGGQPLQVATASALGAEAVCRAIVQRAGAARPLMADLAAAVLPGR